MLYRHYDSLCAKRAKENRSGQKIFRKKARHFKFQDVQKVNQVSTEREADSHTAPVWDK